MALTSNKTRRDLVLAERVTAIGGRLLEVDSSKYGGDLTSYYLYITYDNDPGPVVHYRNGRELDTPYHAYRIIIKGGLDKLDAITSNPAHLAIHAYRERQNQHYKMRKIEDLQRAMDRAQRDYERSAGECEVARIRNQDGPLARNTTDAARLREAVQAYDAAVAAMTAVIGEWPKSADNYYPRY